MKSEFLKVNFQKVNSFILRNKILLDTHVPNGLVFKENKLNSQV